MNVLEYLEYIVSYLLIRIVKWSFILFVSLFVAVSFLLLFLDDFSRWVYYNPDGAVARTRDFVGDEVWDLIP